jgi:hypothetical protein
MTNINIDPNDPFAGIDESEFEAELKRDIRPTTNRHVEKIGNVEIPGFVEDCPKCRGTGSWAAVNGRIGYMNDGSCSKCNGTGKLQFKTSPEARAKGRAAAKARKQRQIEEQAEAFWAQCPNDVADWLKTNRKHSDFAQSLSQAGEKWGQLTEGQTNAVRKAIAREDDAKAGIKEWAKHNKKEYGWLVAEDKNGNEFAGSLLGALKRFGNLTDGQIGAVRRNLNKVEEQRPSDLDISSLRGYYAVPDGETRLKICVRKPGKNSRWHGWTFVDDGAAYGNRQTYGKQAPEGTYQGRIQEQLKKILENPLEAQKAYGHLTGVCGRCGRILEDEESIAAGIGPICATKA